MPFRQQLQHLGMIVTADAAQAVITQRGDGHRTSVVRIVLLRLTRAQQPGSCRQHRRHVDDRFTRRDELLRKEIAEPAGGLDRPHPIRKRSCP
jgi:hypothetical protein